MPFQTIPHTAIQYGLLCFDAHGAERTDDPDGREGKMSQRLVELASEGTFTSIFLFTHGWRGDIPAAIAQYNRWIGAFERQVVDREQAVKRFPGFRSLYIGLHWPSEPWGEEELGEETFATGSALSRDLLLERYLSRLGDTPAIRAALAAVLDEARQNAAVDRLTDRARQAYFALQAALALDSTGVGAPPDADQEPFDPDAAFESGQEASPAFGGGFLLNAFLAPLRQLSFWTMKKRARTVGENGMHAFIKELQQATASQGAGIHLMGHSFGCIVISALLGGPLGNGPLERPVDSAVLVQGALSLWSYSPAIPFEGVGPGYFYRLLEEGKVQGPLVTVYSRHDRAVGAFYPWASRVSSEISFAPGELPKYGAIGAFGLQGLPAALRTEAPMLPSDGAYEFAKGHVYNLDGSQFIRKGTGVAGAHNDIDGPEVAHALWQAALAAC